MHQIAPAAVEASPSDLSALFHPRGIAVIGASADSTRVGGRTLQILRSFDYHGGIYPISRSSAEIGGLRCYATVADAPGPVDLAVLCVGPSACVAAARECADAGVRVVIIYATYGHDQQSEQQLATLSELSAITGLRILGPNTIGSRGVVQDGVFATFANDIESGVTAGSVAIVAQSGGLGVYLGSSYLRRRGAGVRYLVDTGAELDISAADIIREVSSDDEVSCIGVILEGAKDGRALLDAVRAATERGRQVVVLKTGKSDAAAASMQSHTGAIAGDGRLFDEAVRAAGGVVVEDEGAFVDVVSILATGRVPAGSRVGVVSPSGGFGILAIDAAQRYGIRFPHPEVAPTPVELENISSGALVNPFDYASDTASGPEVLRYAVQWMARQQVDVLVIWQAYVLYMERFQEAFIDAIRHARHVTDLPILLCGLVPDELRDVLCEHDVVVFEEPTRAIRAISLVVPEDDLAAQAPRQARSAGDRAIVTGRRARDLLSFVPHVETVPVASAAEAQQFAASYDEVVLKVESDRHPHKSELGLVDGPVARDLVPAAFERVDAARQALDIADPVVLQPRERGLEVVLGAFQDPVFGPAVMVGMGGIHVEVLKDVRVAVAPVTHEQARRMILGLRATPILLGVRGAPAIDVDELAHALVDLSQFIWDGRADWESVDINPVMVRPGGGMVAVDALLVPRTKGGVS